MYVCSLISAVQRKTVQLLWLGSMIAVIVNLQVVLAKSEQAMHRQDRVPYQAMTNLLSVSTPKGMSYVSERLSNSKYTQAQVAVNSVTRS